MAVGVLARSAGLPAGCKHARKDGRGWQAGGRADHVARLVLGGWGEPGGLGGQSGPGYHHSNTRASVRDNCETESIEAENS